jgi:hypothetical protein
MKNTAKQPNYFREQKFQIGPDVVEIYNFIFATCRTRVVELELKIDNKIFPCTMEKWEKTEKKEILPS